MTVDGLVNLVLEHVSTLVPDLGAYLGATLVISLLIFLVFSVVRRMGGH